MPDGRRASLPEPCRVRSAQYLACKGIIDAPGRRAPLTAAGAKADAAADQAREAKRRRPTLQAGGGAHPAPEEGRRNEPTRAERPAAAAGTTRRAPTGRTAEGAATGSPGAGRAAATAPAAQRPGRTGASPGPAARSTGAQTSEPTEGAGTPPAGAPQTGEPGHQPSPQAERRTRPETERTPPPRRGAHNGRAQHLHRVCGLAHRVHASASWRTTDQGTKH